MPPYIPSEHQVWLWKWLFKVLETMMIFLFSNDTWGWNRNFSFYFFTTSKLNIHSEVITRICLSCPALIVYIWYKCIYLWRPNKISHTLNKSWFNPLYIDKIQQWDQTNPKEYLWLQRLYVCFGHKHLT